MSQNKNQLNVPSHNTLNVEFGHLYSSLGDESEALVDNSPSALVEALNVPIDFGAIIDRTDNGNVLCGDISVLTVSERETLVEAGRNGQAFDLAETDISNKATASLRNAMHHKRKFRRQNAGLVFLQDAQEFINTGHPWAVSFGESFSEFWSKNSSEVQTVSSMIKILEDDPRLEPDGVVNAFASQPEYTQTIGYFLAERSLALQARQERFKPVLQKAQAAVASQVQRLGKQMGLSPEHQERALKQVALTSLGSADIAQTHQTDGKVQGAHTVGSLHIAMLTSEEDTPNEVHQVACHEVSHASSAQDGEKRVGLRISKDLGNSENEAMTKFLDEEATGFPSIKPAPDNWFQVRETWYQGEFTAIYGMYLKRPDLFASMYRAYYGQIDNPTELDEAVTLFRKVCATVTVK